MIISDRNLRQSAARRGYRGYGSFGSFGLIAGAALKQAADDLLRAGITDASAEQVGDVAQRIINNTAGAAQGTNPGAVNTGFVDQMTSLGTQLISPGTTGVSPGTMVSGTSRGIYAPPAPSFFDSLPIPLLIGGGLLAAAVVYKVTRKKKAA